MILQRILNFFSTIYSPFGIFTAIRTAIVQLLGQSGSRYGRRSVPYKYSPLPEDGSAIRLIDLFPGSQSDAIRFSISHHYFSKDKFPKYEALSYTWGSTENPITAEVAVSPQSLNIDSSHLIQPLNGSESVSGHPKSEYSELSTIEIGQNLAKALVHLRLTDRPRRLWVDAVCINQQDLAERSQEVKKMRDTYLLADRVVVWLGPASEDSSLAMKTLSFLGQQLIVDFANRASGAARDALEPTWHQERTGLPYTEEAWAAIKSLLERDWFKRVWVWQEIGLANSSAQAVCGFDVIPWQNLAKALFALASKSTHPLLVDPSSRANLGRAYRVAQMGSGKETLLNLVRDGRLSFCTDPRDRIYAMLSIASDAKTWGIQPNYAATVQDVYLDFILRYMHFWRSAGYLGACDYQHLSGSPSWVPNWSTLSLTSLYTSSHAGPLQGTYKYVGNGQLKVKAISCGTLIECREAVSLTPVTAEVQSTIRSWEPQDLLTSTYSSSESLLEAFVTLLVGGMLNSRHSYTEGAPTVAQATDAYLQTVWSGRKETDEETSKNLQVTHSIFRKILDSHLPGRKFFSTDGGHIGLGPLHARTGDRVAVIMGCPHMMTLRPTANRDQYEVVGMCNVQGFRDFEALLGPLPEGWYVEEANIRQYSFEMLFVDSKTGEKTTTDPRLTGDPPGWKAAVGPGGERRWEKEEGGKWVREDPRLADTEFLRDRGIDVQDIILV